MTTLIGRDATVSMDGRPVPIVAKPTKPNYVPCEHCGFSLWRRFVNSPRFYKDHQSGACKR